MDARRVRVAAGVIGGALLLASARWLPLAGWVGSGVDAARDAGLAGAVAFSLVYAVVTLSLVPASLLTLAAGVAWGPVRGAAVVWPGAMLGAVAAYHLSRTVLRDAVARRLGANVHLAALDEAVGEEGAWVTFLLRLSPVVPFGVLNYALGLTRVRPLPYTAATAAGIVPGTLAYAWLGAAAGQVGAVVARGEGFDVRTALGGVGLLATLLATWRIGRAARAALARRMPREEVR